MEDEENVVWSASQVVASKVEVNILVALTLLLVDPRDDVQMAITHCFNYALGSAPRARRVLTPSPL